MATVLCMPALPVPPDVPTILAVPFLAAVPRTRAGPGRVAVPRPAVRPTPAIWLLLDVSTAVWVPGTAASPALAVAASGWPGSGILAVSAAVALPPAAVRPQPLRRPPPD